MRRTHFSDEHGLFRESVAEFCRREVIPNLDEWRRRHLIPREVWLAAGRQDFLGLQAPAALGGTELADFRFNQVLGEELAAASIAVNSSLMLAVDVCAPYLLELTSEAQRERYL